MMSPAFVTADQVVLAASLLIGLAVLAATLGAAVSLSYRWFTSERVPAGLALLAGLAGVAVYLNTTAALGQTIEGGTATVEAALFNIGAFLFGASGALVGHRMGDAFGRDVVLGTQRKAVDEEVSRLVKTVGRVTVVLLPETIDDVVGYNPVAERTKEALTGKQFVFPRKLTISELERRIVSRLKTDYGVGTVDLELADDGSVEYLAVGSRAAGIGPTLPPATNAVALRADPAFAASTGDMVQVWETDPMRRMFTGELRGVADDVVTVAISSADTPKVDPTRQYRLVTLPVEDRPAREFASLLRAAEETYSSVTVEAGSPLHGLPVGALDLTIIGVKPDGGETIVLPSREYVLSPGELVFTIAPPEPLRRLQQAAKPLDSAMVPRDSPDSDGLKHSAETENEESATPANTDLNTATEVTDPDASEFSEANAEESQQEPDATEQTGATDPDAVARKARTPSFDVLKSEFEAGEADWDDETASENNESSSSEKRSLADTGSNGSDDDLVSLDEAEFSFDEENDDFSSLSLDDENDDGLFEDDTLGGDDPFEDDPFEDDDLFENDSFDEGDADNSPNTADTDDEESDEEASDEVEGEENDAKAADDNEDDDGTESDDGGGGTTFAQLKAEFESGDADWGDDVSDSPGGDMRLDE